MSNDEETPIFDKTIFPCPYAQAIKDGRLIDITTAANQAEFKIPVA